MGSGALASWPEPEGDLDEMPGPEPKSDLVGSGALAFFGVDGMPGPKMEPDEGGGVEAAGVAEGTCVLSTGGSEAVVTWAAVADALGGAGPASQAGRLVGRLFQSFSSREGCSMESQFSLLVDISRKVTSDAVHGS